jgi:hypothetical protein
MSTIHLSLEFAGVILPIIDGEDGKARVPFKPIVEYELRGGIFAGTGSSNAKNQRLHDFLSVCRELRLTKDVASRARLHQLMSEFADQLGVGHVDLKQDEHQPDLFGQSDVSQTA